MTKPLVRIAIPLLGALLLGGCGQTLTWVRPDTTVEQVRGDLDQCSRLAFHESSRAYLWRRPFWGHPYAFGPRGFPHYWSDPYFDFDSAFQEQRLQNFCMRSLGYQLQAVEP